MVTLTIRNVSEDVHKALRLSAAANGRSVEAEVRARLAESVQTRAGGVAEQAGAFEADERPSAIGLWGISPPGKSEVDRFIAQRHIEAAFEGDEITPEEYAELNERVDAWELDVEGVDRFIEERRRRT
jgi:plasmid stability protein